MANIFDASRSQIARTKHHASTRVHLSVLLYMAMRFLIDLSAGLVKMMHAYLPPTLEMCPAMPPP